MNPDVFIPRLHQEHFDWLVEKQATKQKKLSVMKNLVDQMPDFDEARELVNGLQTDVAYCESILEYLKKNFNQQSDSNESKDITADEDNDSPENQYDELPQNELISREPMDMLYPKYKGMSMFDIIESILNDIPDTLSSDDVTTIAYDTDSEDEFERAKASISAQLRSGASKGKWLKVGRGYFASHTAPLAPEFTNSADFKEVSANNGHSH